ncbi:MAG: replicative DNA helicase [Myxococcota bacterium]|nr:replicative DNA helicase [Myxococcota bacterium]
MANAPDASWNPPAPDQELRTPPHNDEAERSLLGSIFLDNRVIDEVTSLVQPEDLYRESHRHIFRAMIALHARGDVVDVITLADYLQAEKLLDAVGGPNFLARLSQDVPSAAHVTYYATIVSRKASLRNFITTAHALVDECYNDVSDFEAFMDDAEAKLFAITQAGVKKNYSTMREIIKEAFAQIEALYQKAEQVTGVPSGFIDLDDITAGWQPSDLVIVAARPAMGKCLTASSRVLLQSGEVATIEDLFLRGEAAPLTLNNQLQFDGAVASAFLDDGLKPVWRLTTALGRQVEVTEIHPLLTLDGWSSLGNLSVGDRIGVPRSLPVFGEIEAEHDDLVTMATLLAGSHYDGERLQISVSSDEFLPAMQQVLASHPDVQVFTPERSVEVHQTDSSFVSKFELHEARAGALAELLAATGLWGVTPSDRTIPGEIFQLSEDSLALFLRAFLSASGDCSKPASVRVMVQSTMLLEQLSHLLLRFGVIARLSRDEVLPSLSIEHRPSLEILSARFGLPLSLEDVSDITDVIPVEIWTHIEQRLGAVTWAELFQRTESLLSVADVGRKLLTREEVGQIAEVLESPSLMLVAESALYWDEIVSIEPIGEQQVYDLTVPETHNFVANDVCVHNTALTLNMAAHAAIERKVPVAYFSLEMANVQLAIRMLCSEARVDQGKLRTGRMTEQEWARLIKAAGTLSEAPIFLDDTPALPIMEFRSKARLLKAEQDIGIIFVDYLQLMKARGSNIGSREQEISEISRSLKGIAKELSVPVIALAQLNRGVESRADKRPMNSDLRESGAIEQDADIISFIYRDEVYNPESEHKGIGEVILGKHRNGSLGTVRLRFFGQYTRFENLAPDVDDGGGGGAF